MGLVAGVALVGFTVVNLPASYEFGVVSSDRRLRPNARELTRQLRTAGLPSPVLFDRSKAVFAEPYSYAVLVALQEEGVEFTFDDDSTDVNRFGESRADRGRARRRLVLVTGPAARTASTTGERVAYASLLSDADLRERTALTTEVTQALVEGVLRLTLAGERELDDGAYPAVVDLRAGLEVAPNRVASAVARLDAANQLVGPDRERTAVRRMASLYQRDTLETVALFLEPLS